MGCMTLQCRGTDSDARQCSAVSAPQLFGNAMVWLPVRFTIEIDSHSLVLHAVLTYMRRPPIAAFAFCAHVDVCIFPLSGRIPSAWDPS
jgi:hypothetical protein